MARYVFIVSCGLLQGGRKARAPIYIYTCVFLFTIFGNSCGVFRNSFFGYSFLQKLTKKGNLKIPSRSLPSFQISPSSHHWTVSEEDRKVTNIIKFNENCEVTQQQNPRRAPGKLLFPFWLPNGTSTKPTDSIVFRLLSHRTHGRIVQSTGKCQSAGGAAAPQLHYRASTASARSQRACIPDVNGKCQIGVGYRTSTASARSQWHYRTQVAALCWTSTASARSQWALWDLNTQYTTKEHNHTNAQYTIRNKQN